MTVPGSSKIWELWILWGGRSHVHSPRHWHPTARCRVSTVRRMRIARASCSSVESFVDPKSTRSDCWACRDIRQSPIVLVSRSTGKRSGSSTPGRWLRLSFLIVHKDLALKMLLAKKCFQLQFAPLLVRMGLGYIIDTAHIASTVSVNGIVNAQ